MVCPKCGNYLSDNVKFCTKCGCKLYIDNSDFDNAQISEDPYINTPIDMGLSDGTSYSSNNQSGSAPSREPFVWKDQYTYIAIAGAIVIAAGIGFAFKMHNASNNVDSVKVAIENNESSLIQEKEYEYTDDSSANDDNYSDYEGVNEENEDLIAEVDIFEDGNINVDVENSVLEIREEYNNTVERINSGFYEVRRGHNEETVYFDDGKIRVIIISKDSSGEDYSKYYYYTREGRLYFAYYEGTDANRFYFVDGRLIRWRYSSDMANSQNAENYDLENDNDEYALWERLVQQDSDRYLSMAEDLGEEPTDYILPNSDSRYLRKEDIEGFTAEECRLARNELYARYGRLFDDEGLQAYFNSKEWYEGKIKPADFQESMLNDYEVYNRDLIVSYEEEKGYR